MNRENIEAIRERILSLIDSEYESDASFEREMGLAEKTVNNWRRGRSSSFMRILPELSEQFGINVGAILDIPIKSDTSELSDDERSLLALYRRSHALPPKMREALRSTLESTIEMYVTAATEMSSKRQSKKTGLTKK